ncbi:MAG TPA: hypothetical protein VGK80_06025 [Rhodanobacteraceae bacterium]
MKFIHVITIVILAVCAISALIHLGADVFVSRKFDQFSLIYLVGFVVLSSTIYILRDRFLKKSGQVTAGPK